MKLLLNFVKFLKIKFCLNWSFKFTNKNLIYKVNYINIFCLMLQGLAH